MSADVAGYSRLMGKDESGTLAALKAHVRELIAPAVEEYGGRIVKSTGDGMLLEFASVVDAVRCAVDVQHGMAARNEHVATDDQIEFRIGINVGDIIIDGDDIFGDGVNVAARLQTLAEPGQIYVSRVVRDHVLDKLSFAFEDLGSHTVKNIAHPIEVYAVREAHGAAAGAAMAHRSGGIGTLRWVAAGVAIALACAGLWAALRGKGESPAHAPALSVTVLPFAATDAEPDNQRLAEHLTSEMALSLAHWRWASVANPPQPHPGQAWEPVAIARALNVRYVVAGEVRSARDKVAVTSRLVDASSQSNVWTDSVEFARGAPGNDEDAQLARLTRRLQTALYNAEIRRAAAESSSRSPWDLVLRGDAAIIASTDTVSNREVGRSLYDQALKADPNFVPALVSIAMTDNSLLSNDLDLSAARRQQTIDELNAVSARAVSIDPADASTWYHRSGALTWLDRWDEALAANSRAEALAPSNALFVGNRAMLLLVMGRADEAVTLAERAKTMERGIMGEEGAASRVVCQSRMLLGRYDDALPECESAAARDNWWGDQVWLVAGYAQQGRSDRARVARDELLKSQPRFTIAKFQRSDPAFDVSAYRERAEKYVFAGLRAAGLPER